MRYRSAAGTVTEEARDRFGIGKTGKFPVFDRQSALAAIRLRHHSSDVSAKVVLDKVARWARENEDTVVLEAVKRARQVDKKRQT